MKSTCVTQVQMSDDERSPESVFSSQNVYRMGVDSVNFMNHKRQCVISSMTPDVEQMDVVGASSQAFLKSSKDDGEKCHRNPQIDLTCHETDSAVVTSTSDVIPPEHSDNSANHSGSNNSSANEDEKVSGFESGKEEKVVAQNCLSNLVLLAAVLFPDHQL